MPRATYNDYRLLTALAAWLLVTLVGCGTNEYVPPPPPRVDVARPVQQTITRSLEFTGTTAPSESVAIQARVKGFLQEIKFEEGSDNVQAGDVLYVIDPKPFQVAVDQAAASVELAVAQQQSAAAQLASAQAERRNAELQLSRSRAAGGAVTAAEIDELEAALGVAEAGIIAGNAAIASAKAQVSAAKAALEDAELDLSYTQVRSPIEGRVGRTLVDVGNLVGANETTHLTTVVRYDPLYAYYTISESVLLQWIEWQQQGRVGASPSAKESPRDVYLGLANEQGYPHRGRFDYADLAVDESSGTFLIRAVFDNPDKQIPPGAFVRIQVPLFPEEVLLVDEAAVSRDQAGAFVLVVNAENEVVRRSIEVGERYQGMRVVEAGLSPDDRVVVNGLQRARPGAEVQATEVDMSPPSDSPPASDAAPANTRADAPASDPAANESLPSVTN